MESITPVDGYEKYDGCYGTVTRRCGNNVHLKLDNGQDAFAFKFGSLLPGTKVLCTVYKLATEDKDMVVSIDSVVEYMPLAG